MRFLLLALALAIGTVADAELTLKVTGPSESETGNLVVLDSTASTANAVNWIFPPELDGRTLVIDGKLVFATRDAGTYRVVLYGTDGELLNHVTHTVVITNPDAEPDKPTDPDKPDPPAGDFTSLRKLSYDLSKAIGDERTRARLAMRIMGADFTKSPTEVDEQIQLIITRTFAETPRSENDHDWSSGWYQPILAALGRLVADGEIRDVSDLKQAMQAVTDGLTG